MIIYLLNTKYIFLKKTVMPDRQAPTHGSSTDDEEQFMFDDENTIQRTDIPGTHAPIIDLSSMFYFF